MNYSIRLAKFGLCFASLALLSGTAHAALIPAFGLGDFPNFDSIELLVAYDSDSDSLFAIGNNVSFASGEEGAIDTVDGSGFKMLMAVDSGGHSGGGSLEISGFIPELGFTSGTLLTGEIIDFGWIEDSSEGATPYELQVVFTITGGDAAGLFGPTGAMGFAQTDFQGSWLSDWVNDFGGESVTAPYSPVPVPGALLLLGSGLLGLTRFARRRSSQA